MNMYRPGDYSLDDPALVSAFDELPLWSAPFGAALLDALPYRRGMNVLDLGTGSGFPLLEIAERLGSSSSVYGLDPWGGGADRARAKACARDIRNALLVRGTAERIPFRDRAFDLLVSNNGLNNVADISTALDECRRVCKDGATLVMTVNLPGSMEEFYAVYRAALRELGMDGVVPCVDEHIRKKRLPRDETLALLRAHRFEVQECRENIFSMRFTDGSTLFEHSFIRVAFLGPWQEVVGERRASEVFNFLEEKLNDMAVANGGLALSIPFICVKCCAR
jgi:arsenite methyltransferase